MTHEPTKPSPILLAWPGAMQQIQRPLGIAAAGRGTATRLHDRNRTPIRPQGTHWTGVNIARVIDICYRYNYIDLYSASDTGRLAWARRASLLVNSPFRFSSTHHFCVNAKEEGP